MRVSVSDRHRIDLVRWFGTIAGLLFGFLVVALLNASEAQAEGQDQDRPSSSETSDRPDTVLGAVTGLLGGVSEAATPIVEPVAKTVQPVVEPVARIAAPVVDTVAPLVDPVVRIVEPVVDTVAPALEPVTEPLLNAAAPVVDPVAEAIHAEPIVSGLNGGDTPQDRGLPTGRADTDRDEVDSDDVAAGRTPGAAVSAPVVDWQTQPAIEPVVTLTEQAGEQAGARATVRSADDVPGAPFTPGSTAVGTAHAVAGPSGSGTGDLAVAAAGISISRGETAGRGPPGSVDAANWRGYADRSHPS